MSTRRGARELGLDVQWQWDFRGPGSTVHTRADTIALDLGNRLGPGVIDQHQDASLGQSTADLVFRRDDLVYDHLMQPWLNRADDGQKLSDRSWRPILITHRTPDFDGIVAALLCMELVETGEFPRWADSLVKLASAVDQAKVRTLGVDKVNPLSIFYAFYALSSKLKDEARARRGLELIRHEAETLSAGVEGRLKVSDWLGDKAGAWVSFDADSQEMGTLLAKDRETYEKELSDGLHQQRKVKLPCFEGGVLTLIDVDAMVTRATREPQAYSQSRLLKYWIRQSDVPMMICPRLNGDEQHTVTISLDPTWTDDHGRQPTLAGLGYALELKEKKAREDQGGDTRLKRPRFDDGTVDNDDPWYDGRGHDHTIVESPRSGTRLTDEEIAEIASSEFWHRRVRARVQVLWVQADMQQEDWPEDAETEQLSDDLSQSLKEVWSDLRKHQAPPPPWAAHLPSDSSEQPRVEQLTSELIRWEPLHRFSIHRSEWRFEGMDARLVDWLDRLRRREEPIYLMVEFETAPPGLTPEQVCSRLMGLSIDEVRRSEVLVDGVGITARTLLCFGESCKHLSRELRNARGDDLRRLQLHVALLHGKLNELLHYVSSGTSHSSSGELVDELHTVLSGYDQPEVSENIGLQRCYDVLADRVKLTEIRDKARHEKGTIESRIEQKHGRNTELILYLIGLMGIIEATNGIQSLLTMEPVPAGDAVTWLWLGEILPPWYWIGGGGAAFILAAVGLWHFYRK